MAKPNHTRALTEVPPLPEGESPDYYNVVRDQGGWTLIVNGKVIHSVDLLGTIMTKLEEAILRKHGLIGSGGV
jgi:hypothetical protein